MDNYKYDMLEQAKELINDLDEKDYKRIIIDLDDNYTDETELTITVELNKDYSF